MPSLSSSTLIVPTKRPRHLMLCALALLLCQACSSTRSERGVETHWHDLAGDQLQPGVTTRQQVLAALGPPSQIVNMQHETALYYMLERSQAKGVTLIVYNFRRERATFDRAVFFFDLDGLLTEFAFTDEQSGP